MYEIQCPCKKINNFEQNFAQVLFEHNISNNKCIGLSESRPGFNIKHSKVFHTSSKHLCRPIYPFRLCNRHPTQFKAHKARVEIVSHVDASMFEGLSRFNSTHEGHTNLYTYVYSIDI